MCRNGPALDRFTPARPVLNTERGWAADCWLLNSNNSTDFVDAGDARFQRFLADAAASPWLHQIGLAGSADIAANRAAAGATVFSDDGADHVHLGAQ